MNFRMLFLIPLLMASVTSLHAKKKIERLNADLDPWFLLPGAYGKTPDDLERDFPKGDFKENPYFEWLRQDKTRAIFKRNPAPNVRIDLTLLGGKVPVEEMVVDFKNGKYEGITVSVFNKGDGGEISLQDAKSRCSELMKSLGTQLAVKPRRREGNKSKGVMTSGFVWESPRGKAVLVYNPETPSRTEFIRMRLSRKEAGGIYQAAMEDRTMAAVGVSDLPKRVVHKDGYVTIPTVPMVDQGGKGYCVVASVQRLFEYYGVDCDMHQLAVVAGSDPREGTEVLHANEQLGKIDYLFKTRFSCLAVRHENRLVELKDENLAGRPVPPRTMEKIIVKRIDEGVPLLWSMRLGIKPEEPPLENGATGGHMRMIIGYSDDMQKVVFTDSWGGGSRVQNDENGRRLQSDHSLVRHETHTALKQSGSPGGGGVHQETGVENDDKKNGHSLECPFFQ